MEKFVLFILLAISIYSSAQQTYVPDDNFEQALIDLGYDNPPLDDYVSTANISEVTYLDISWLNIADLTGIEDFISISNLSCEGNYLTILELYTNTALSHLRCHSNMLTGLDMSSNPNLTYLNCSFNSISNLHISTNSALSFLDCGFNDLTSIDISGNPALSIFICNLNQLTYLDLSNNMALTELDCPVNELTDLDLSQNSNLSYLRCNMNNISSLDLSTNIELNYLYCRVNQLESLDLSSNAGLIDLDCDNNAITSLTLSENSALTKLICYSNELTDLNLSANTVLNHIRCNDNQLLNLDIRNGNNSIITNFDASHNADLICIYVDDKNASYLANWLIDTVSSFVETEEECTTLTIHNLDNDSKISIYPNPSKGIFKIEYNHQNIKQIIITDIRGKKVFQQKFLSNNEQIDLSSFSNGIYFIRLVTEKEIIIQKIIMK